jgi:MYXO-CTERM domain-containing protein
MRRFTVAAFVLGAAGVLVPPAARAHFILQAPASSAEQGALGDPQKTPPCGGDGAVPTGTVTAYAPGDMVTVTINETVPHPGHYRVALSTTGPSGLPADPAVTPTAGDECGSTVVQSPPVFPILADGMLEHTSAFSAPQSFSFRLPTDMTCTSNCVLQVIEYMSSHGAPCFYHHCANITIQAGGGGDAGTGGNDAGSSGDSSSGCGCASGGGRTSFAGVASLLMAIAVRRPRRRDRTIRITTPPGTRTGS